MRYYEGLIKRKFKGLVGSKYETFQKEYREYMLTEEEMRPREIKKILLPLDFSVTSASKSVAELLSVYNNAVVTLIFITDAQVYDIIAASISDEAGMEYIRKKKDYGEDLLDEYENSFALHNISCKRRMIVGNKRQDVLKMAPDYDLIVLPKCYASNNPVSCTVSEDAIILAQSLGQSTIVF
jgi:hypothetical protein